MRVFCATHRANNSSNAATAHFVWTPSLGRVRSLPCIISYFNIIQPNTTPYNIAQTKKRHRTFPSKTLSNCCNVRLEPLRARQRECLENILYVQCRSVQMHIYIHTAHTPYILYIYNGIQKIPRTHSEHNAHAHRTCGAMCSNTAATAAAVAHARTIISRHNDRWCCCANAAQTTPYCIVYTTQTHTQHSSFSPACRGVNAHARPDEIRLPVAI